MKRIIISILFFTIPFLGYSQKVNESTAREVAQNVLMMDYPDLKHQMIEKVIPVGLDNDTLYFIFTYPEDGYVIISAESSAPPVLGHCKKGKYVPENMPPGLLYLLDKYKYAISSLREKNVKQTKQVKELWDSYLSSGFATLKSYTVGQEMIDTKWGQQSGYNQSCPSNRPAGCTAVAMAQILKYWECRTNPTGSVSYPDGWNIFVGSYKGASADFGATTYNWADMHDLSADVDNALLIFHAGASCETYYGKDASYAPPGRARDGFVDYWGISSNADVKWRISHLSNWQDMLEDELDLERPLLYTGGSVGPAHSWVIDGYYNNGSFSCKWGWYGNHDGQYSLGNFDPPGPRGPYNQFESAIFDVYTEQPISGPSVVCTSNSTFTIDNALPGTTVTWTATGVTPSSGTGTTAIFHSTCPSNMHAQIIFTYSSPCENYTQFSQIFGSGGPHPSDVSLVVLDNQSGQAVDPMFLCPNTMYNLYYENNGSCNTSNHSWTLPYGMTLINTSQNWALINTNSSSGGMLMIHGQTCCTSCGSNVLLLTDVLATNGYDCGGGWYMSFVPNPATEETTLELKTDNIENYTEDDEWEMEVYNQQQVLIYKTTNLKDKKQVINTSAWTEGIYFVRVKMNNKMYFGKFVVTR